MLTNLSLSDLIALRDYCYQESLAFKNEDFIEMDYQKWHDRFKLCDKELSERVEKIFEG